MDTFDIEKNNIEFIIKYYSTPEDMQKLTKIETKIKDKEKVTQGEKSDVAAKKRDDALSNLQKKFILSTLEWESKDFSNFIDNFSEVSDPDTDLLINSILSKKLPYKKIKLYEHFNIKVFTNSSYPGIISYKNKDNIESELWKIYYDIFGEPSGNTLSFVDNKTYTKDENKWKLNGTELSLCNEFLIVDGKIPNFLKSKKVVYYSALYNYLPAQLRLELSPSNNVANLINIMSGYQSNESYKIKPTESNFDSKWLDRQEKFQRFLVEIYRRTINY